MRYKAEIPKHEHALRDVDEADLAFAIVRDPIDRFRSAYDMYRKNGKMGAFPTVDDFIRAGPTEWMREEWGSGFWPLTWWLDSADYVRQRDIIVMHIDSWADDMWHMGLGRPGTTHEAEQRSVVTERWPLLDHYAADYELLEGL